MKSRNIVMLVALPLLAVFIFASCAGEGTTTPAPTLTPTTTATPVSTPTTQTLDLIMGKGVTIAEVDGEEVVVADFHRWEPGVIVVNKGDTIDLTVTIPGDDAHSFILPDFGVVTPRIEPEGGTAQVSFVADKAGVFQFACGLSPDEALGNCAPDHPRQVGYLIVLDDTGTQNFDLVMGEGETMAEVDGEEEIVAEFHRWEPDVIVVNKGDTVDLTVSNPRSHAHSFILPDFGVVTTRLEPRGGTAQVSFVADKAGVFQFACGLPPDEALGDCAPDHRRQVGYLIVLDDTGTQNFDLVMGEGETIAEVDGEEEIVAEFHRWEPGVIVVNKGDTVNLAVSNPRGSAHSFILPDFGVATTRLEPRGGTAQVSFVADKAGVFQFACGLSPDEALGNCDPDHLSQVGYLIVLDTGA